MKLSLFRLYIVYFFVLLLMIYPFSLYEPVVRPFFIVLLWVYVQCLLPKVFHLYQIMIMGLFLDVMMHFPLGIHVFSLVFCSWCVSFLSHRFRFLSQAQQLLCILFFSFMYQSSLFLWMKGFADQITVFQFFIPIVMTVCCWPVFYVFLEYFLYCRPKHSRVRGLY